MFRSINGAFFFLLVFIGSQMSAAVADIPFSEPRQYKFTYGVEVTVPKSDIGKKVSLWVPFPVKDKHQRLLRYNFESPWPYTITVEKKYGNRMVYLEGKTTSEKTRFNFIYYVRRKPEKSHGVKKGKGHKYALPERYLGPNEKVPFYPRFKELADAEAKGITIPSKKIRAFYDYIVRTMRYDKSGKGWGQGDAIWACDAKRGNCTDFHSLFIGMSRSHKIPARFEIGVPIPHHLKSGEIPGYHCWAQAYAKDLEKWIPLDASEAKKSGKVNDFFGTLPSDRIKFTQGRDIVLNPAQNGKPLNYFIYPYVEIDGQELSTVTKKFTFKRL